MESALPSVPSFKINTLWPDFLKTHLRLDSSMDTNLSIKVPGAVVPYVIYLASTNCIKLRAGLSILKIRWYKFSTFLFTICCTLSIFSAFNMAVLCERLERPSHCLIRRPCVYYILRIGLWNNSYISCRKLKLADSITSGGRGLFSNRLVGRTPYL